MLLFGKELNTDKTPYLEDRKTIERNMKNSNGGKFPFNSSNFTIHKILSTVANPFHQSITKQYQG